MLPTYPLFLQSDVAVGPSSYSHNFGVVKIDNILLYPGRTLISITNHHKRWMHYTLTVKYIFFAFVDHFSLNLLLADLTTQIIVKILIAIWKIGLRTWTYPIFHAKVVTIFNWACAYAKIKQRIWFYAVFTVAVSAKLPLLVKTGHNWLVYLFGRQKILLWHSWLCNISASNHVDTLLHW